MRRVGARGLKQHTGEVLERVRAGERVVITYRGEAIAVISPVDRKALEESLKAEAQRAERESLGWLAASEDAFSLWDNEDDAVWDEVAGRPEG